MIRQGDVLLVPREIPPAAKPVASDGRVVLAYGEATGHAHTVDAGTLYETADGHRFLRLERSTQVLHQEHTALPLEAGTYQVVIQREYVAPEIDRRVLD